LSAAVTVREQYGRFAYYRLRPEAVEALAGELAQLAAAARSAYAAGARRPCP
jgi:ArsR family transcriptional regulator, arsenate/arsenite/antimonite-responsive transcriptional repressor